ncbi:hypothetical protein PR202_ga14107 [Eleusine coracana subsp. coracana]|uniref:Uncharacterized protein n=1 Tax=Eleusine coracana subsp. coracana TaxID=191504 RepID=A0AAV5CG83_ELECO|nr:hypothetical protein PR202_ga14107 [Eleusine coracana subsp. coracana]
METKDDMLHIVSRKFSGKRHTWRIICYPVGGKKGSENMDYIALFLLVYDDTVVDEAAVVAQATFSLLDQDGNPVPSYSRTTIVKYDFSQELRPLGIYKFINRKDLEQSGLLKDDCFAVRVDVHLVGEAYNNKEPLPPSTQHLGDLLSKSKAADVEFRVGGEMFPAHRQVLKARSPVFKAQLATIKDEGTTTDTNVIVQIIDDIEPRVFSALLTFIYTDVCPAEMNSSSDVGMTQSLLIAADKYCIHRLKLICEDRLCNRINTRSVSILLVLAEKHSCPSLREACFDFLGTKEVLFEVVQTKEYEHLARSCPTITNQLIYNVLNRKKADTADWSQEVQVSIIKIA